MDLIQLSAADYDRVVELWRLAGLPFRAKGRDARQAFIKQLESGVQTVLGLEQQGELVGVVVATHDGRKGWVNRLAIDPAHRRQGFALALIEAAEEHLSQQGIEVIATLIEAQNNVSRELFLRAGYQEHPDILYASKRPSSDC